MGRGGEGRSPLFHRRARRGRTAGRTASADADPSTRSPRPLLARDHLHPTVREYVESRALAASYDDWFAGLPLFEYDCVFIDEHLTSAPVLDLGCGTGRHLLHLASRGIPAFGLDLNGHMLAEASAALRAERLPERLARADFHALPLRFDARFGGILLMFSTLGLVRSSALRLRLLTSLRPHLAPDGRLLLHVHNRHRHPETRTVGWGPTLAARLAGDPAPEPGDTILRNYRGVQDLFLHLFTAEELSDLLFRAGYSVEEIRPLNERRDGPWRGPDAHRRCNGFLVAAKNS